jgi:hypothetical protein
MKHVFYNGYNGVRAAGFVHRVNVLQGDAKRARKFFPHVHLVASLTSRRMTTNELIHEFRQYVPTMPIYYDGALQVLFETYKLSPLAAAVTYWEWRRGRRLSVNNFFLHSRYIFDRDRLIELRDASTKDLTARLAQAASKKRH